MSLTPGTRVGSYEVVGAIGAGGMGEVYRARDTKLNRDVALKVLPDGFAADSDRLARFQREAQVLASLNHPNIAAIHGLEESNGIRALVLELVEGPTLADRIAEGPIPLDEALPIARQIAEALEAAHERGIIHRDLKPANIKLRPDGTVKVLDFGLAKAFDAQPAAGSPTLSMSPTITTPAMTNMGVILGTAAYMSPEQAKGKPVDKRSDIWAFGCVLYEMLTGRRVFDGDDVGDALAAVLRAEPDWKVVPADVPDSIRFALARCLEKDPRRRLHTAADVALFLDPTGPFPITAAATRSPFRRTAYAWGFAATVAAALAAGAGITWILLRPDPTTPIVTRFAITPARGEMAGTFTPDPDVAISADGHRIVYAVGNVGAGGTAGQNQIYVRALDQLEPSALRGLGPGGARSPFLSPDGEWVGFFEGGTLKKVAVNGGPPLALAVNVETPRGASWGADGTIILATSDPGTGLLRVAANGEIEVLTRPDPRKGETDHLFPETLPGARAVLFTIATGSPPRSETVGGTAENYQVAVLDLRTGGYRVLIRGASNPRYAASGQIVYGVAGSLRAVAFDLDQLEVTSDPVPVLEGVVTKASGAANFSLAQNGTLAYLAGDTVRSSQRTLVRVDQNGREEPIATPARTFTRPRVSPDGARIVTYIEDSADLWIYELRRGTLERLTSDANVDSDAIWSPDGKRIAYFSAGRDGKPGIHVRSADFTGEPKRITTGNHRPTTWTRDGTRIVFLDLAFGYGAEAFRPTDVSAPARGNDLSIVAVDGNQTPSSLLDSPAREDMAAISPDGRWLAYETNETGQGEIVVRPFPNVGSGRWRISPDGGNDPVWARDGRTLFYRRDETIMSVEVRDGAPSSWGIPQSRFQAPYLFATGPIHWDVGPDGRFVMIKTATEDDGSMPRLVVIENWFEELKRLMPQF